MKRVLLIGAGGLGSPVALLLARRGGVHLTLIDDDVVDLSNLHRQTLFSDADVGLDKTTRAKHRVLTDARQAGVSIEVATIEGRFVPENADALVRDADIVVEGADNLATKFLVADAAQLARKPSVHAGVVRWAGWSLASVPGASACLRCLFEDLPRDRVETCAEAGVVGPLVGAIGALEAMLVLDLLDGKLETSGVITHVDALRGTLRRSNVRPRVSCALCGTRSISSIEASRYFGGPVQDDPLGSAGSGVPW